MSQALRLILQGIFLHSCLSFIPSNRRYAVDANLASFFYKCTSEKSPVKLQYVSTYTISKVVYLAVPVGIS